MSLSNIKSSMLDLVSKYCQEKFKDKEFNFGEDHIPVSGKVIDKSETIWLRCFRLRFYRSYSMIFLKKNYLNS